MLTTLLTLMAEMVCIVILLPSGDAVCECTIGADPIPVVKPTPTPTPIVSTLTDPDPPLPI